MVGICGQSVHLFGLGQIHVEALESIMGAVTMKMMSRTIMTSTKGVTLISETKPFFLAHAPMSRP